MKLELKHLAPYLPYELTGVCTEEFTGIELVLGISQYKNSKEHYLITNFDDLDIEMFKPILRPLSDLTKEIEVNGEKFKPVETLRKDYPSFFFEFTDSLIFKSKNTNLYTSVNWINEINNKLFEWHFDVFGLIPQGLAIDINKTKIVI